MENNISAKVNKAKGGQLLGFSFNNASTNTVFNFISLYFLVYCTEIYGFSALLVGSIMMGTRLFDAFTDPFIGYMIDTTNTKFGRFRPWILGGAILSGAMIILMFSGIKTGSKMGDLLMIISFYSVWVLGYTAQTACTKSVQNILTSVAKQRSLINALGTLFSILVYLFAMAGALPIIKASGGIADNGAWVVTGMIFAALQLIFAVFVVLGIRKKDVPEYYVKRDVAEKPKLMDFISIFKTNRALQMLIIAASTNKITQTMQSGLTVLLFVYVAANQSYQSIVPLVTVPFMIIATFIMIKMIDKYGRKETFTFSSWGGFLFGFAAIALVPLNPTSLVWIIFVASLNMVLAAGAGDINIISMIADSADYEYYTRNRFVPSMIGAAFSLIDKMISSFGTLIIGAILTGIGFVSITETEPSPIMFWAVLAMYFGFPAIGHLCSIISMKFYPLDKKTHEKMVAELAQREQNMSIKLEADNEPG